MLKLGEIVELLVTTAMIVVLGVIVFFSSAHGARGLAEIYGDTAQFRLATLLAITAFRWTPFLFGGLLLGYLWLRFQASECRWAACCALSIAALTTALVLYGLVVPFANTTFRMGNH
ncbi:MAG: hypothetical protein ABIQ96_24330 [Luteolibacter sp.]